MQRVDVTSDEVHLCIDDLCLFGDGQDSDFQTVASELCYINGWNSEPQNAQEARTLYLALKRELEQTL